MQIKVNTQHVILGDQANLEQLLSLLDQPKQGVALAVNQQVISRSRWAEHKLREGDDITLIKATAGG